MIECPFCHEGYLLKEKLEGLDQWLYACMECDLIWRDPKTINEKNGIDYFNFLKMHHLPKSAKVQEIDETWPEGKG